MLKKFCLAALASLSIFTTSCAHKPPDGEICLEMEPTVGWCRFSLSGKEVWIDEEHPYSFTGDPKDKMTWWEQRNLMFLIPFGTWVKIKTFIIEICKDTGRCSDEVDSWDRTVNRLDEQHDLKLP